MSWSNAAVATATHSFEEYIHLHLQELERNIGLLLLPILEELGPLHTAGEPHGGIHPGALRYSLNDEFDGGYFMAQRRQSGNRPGPQVGHAYLAPEVIEGAGEDLRADCYALGALMFQVITGHPPVSALRRVKKEEALRAEQYPAWPPAILAVVNRCLALEKADRIANVQELWQEVSAALPQSATQPERLENEAKAGSQTTTGDDAMSAVPSAMPCPEPADSGIGAPLVELPLSPGVEANAVVMPVFFPGKIEVRERLANGSVNKAYRQNIRELFGSQAGRVTIVAVEVPAESGLCFDPLGEVVHGVPTKAGEWKLSLDYQITQPGSPTRRQSLALTINPDPASLWKNLASDPNALFAKPDAALKYVETPHLTLLAASLRGRSHAHVGKHRDDDFALCCAGLKGWHILIAADGAGSAKYSRRGSEIACRTAAAELETTLAGGNELDEALAKLGDSMGEEELEKLRKVACNLLVQPAYRALAAIQREAQEQQALLRDFSTTFILVVVKKLESKWFFASFAIGDGGAGVVCKEGEVRLLTRPDSGEFAGQTVFLTTPQIFTESDVLLSRTQAFFCDEFRFLAVMTDGITDPIFQNDAEFASGPSWGRFGERLSQVVSLTTPQPGMEQALLEWLNFPSPGNHDDRTLLLAVPASTLPRQ